MDKRNMILPVLAPAFNALLGIAEGFFGRTPKSSTVTPSAFRALKVVQENRKAHRARLGEDGMDPIFTRQQRRAQERRLEKDMRVKPVAEARLKMARLNHERKERARRLRDMMTLDDRAAAKQARLTDAQYMERKAHAENARRRYLEKLLDSQ